jgi:hypothetical protein
MTNTTLDQANRLDNALFDLAQMVAILQETVAELRFEDSDPNAPQLRRAASVVDVVATLANAAGADALCVAVNRSARITRPRLMAAE